jgi:nicotinamide riboside transporter PnuC
MRRIGADLIVLAYAMLLITSLSAPGYAHSHPQLGTAMIAEYASAWPVALACALVVAGVMLALIPIRRGERWALWTTLAIVLILLITRLATDPRCLAAIHPHEHGCHTFMAAMLLAIVGLILAR